MYKLLSVAGMNDSTAPTKLVPIKKLTKKYIKSSLRRSIKIDFFNVCDIHAEPFRLK